MDTQQGFIKYFVIIIVILAVVFLSQQALFRGISKTFVSDATDKAGAYLSKASTWASSVIYPKISGEVQKRGDTINNAINQEKQKVSEDIGKKIENYFSGIADSVLHPGENNNCQISSVQTPAVK